MAWRVSLPLIRKKKAFNFIVLASCFLHIPTDGTDRALETSSRSVCLSHRFLFCGPFVISRHWAAIYIQRTHALRKKTCQVITTITWCEDRNPSHILTSALQMSITLRGAQGFTPYLPLAALSMLIKPSVQSKMPRHVFLFSSGDI